MRKKEEVLGERKSDGMYNSYLNDEEKMLKGINNLNKNIGLLVEVLVDIRDILAEGYKVEIKLNREKSLSFNQRD